MQYSYFTGILDKQRAVCSLTNIQDKIQLFSFSTVQLTYCYIAPQLQLQCIGFQQLQNSKKFFQKVFFEMSAVQSSVETKKLTHIGGREAKKFMGTEFPQPSFQLLRSVVYYSCQLRPSEIVLEKHVKHRQNRARNACAHESRLPFLHDMSPINTNVVLCLERQCGVMCGTPKQLTWYVTVLKTLFTKSHSLIFLKNNQIK